MGRIYYILIILFLELLNTTQSFAINIITNNIKEVRNFTGRIDFLDKLTSIKKNHQNIFIHGEAGIGKTQLVRRFVEKIKNQYHIVWWFDLESDEEWQYRSLLNNAEKLLPKNTIKQNITPQNIIHILIKNGYKLMLIFDNLSDRNKATTILNKLGKLENISKLFISRKNLNLYLNESIEVTGLNDIESIKYLSKYLNKRGTKDDIKKMNILLKGHPLFLEQAISYILQSPRLRILDYIDLLKKESFNILSVSSNKIDFSYNDYSISPYNVIKLPVLAIKKNNKDSYSILKKISFLSDNFSEKILIELYKARNSRFSIVDFNKTLDNIINYNVMTYNKNIYNIHELKRSIINQEFSDIEDLKEVVTAITNLFPKEIGKLAAFIEDNPLILDNMSNVYYHLLDKSVVNKESIILKIKLLNIYMVQYQYDKALGLIESIENDISKISISIKDKLRKDIIYFMVLQSRYYRIKQFDDPKALINLEKAKNLLNENDPEDLQFFVLAQEALTYSELGDIKKSKNLTKQIDHKLNSYVNDDNMPMKPFYLRLKRDFFEEEGKYDHAIANILNSVNSYDTKSEKRKLYEYIPLAVLLIKVGKLSEADKYIKKCQIISDNKEDTLDNNKNVISLHILNARYHNANNNLSKAEKEIELARNSLKLVTDSFSSRQANKHLFEILDVTGDLFFNKGEYGQAVEKYIEAEDILLELYNNKVQKRVFSEIYEKILVVALKMKDKQLAKKYFNIQKENFGEENDITRRMSKYININDLEIS